MTYKVPFSLQSRIDGYWEMFHDDDCGETLEDYNWCPKCKFRVDMQSFGVRPTAKNEKVKEAQP